MSGTRVPADAAVRAPEERETAPLVEPDDPLKAAAPDSKLSASSMVGLQRSAGNATVARLISSRGATGGDAGEGASGDDAPEEKADTTVTEGPRARGRHSTRGSRRPRAASAALPPLLQRAPPKAPAPEAPGKDTDKPLSDIVLEHLMQPLEVSVETKGPSSSSYVKLNKASAKGAIKISPHSPTDGDVNVGATPSGKTGDKNGMAIAIAAEAKQKARTELNKKIDAGISDLIKQVTGKDNALKTELFAKAKAEAKGGTSGGKPEFSTKVGYDFGIDATIFGTAKVTMQVKLTLIGLKAKSGKKGFEFEATAFAAEVGQKVTVKWKEAFSIHEIPFDVEGSIEWGAEFEPNWAKIAADAAADVGTEAAVMAAIDFALVAGPPLLAGFVLASGIVLAGEKGALHASILEAAQDARGAAMVFAQVMTGSDLAGAGPRAQKAHDAAMGQIKSIAKGSGMEPEELMTELRQNPASNFTSVYGQARQQIYSAFDGEVGGIIAAWRKEHYILAIWSRAEDDMSEAKRLYDPLLAK